jgi:hypothetical protein
MSVATVVLTAGVVLCIVIVIVAIARREGLGKGSILTAA